jgi:nitroreductase
MAKQNATYYRSKEGSPNSVLIYYEKLVHLAYSQGPFSILMPLKKLLFWGVGLFNPTLRGPASHADMRVWAHKTTALACENLMLAFRAAGYDSCPMEGFDEVRVRKLLKLPRGAEVCMVVGAGKRAENGIYGPQIRFSRDQFVKQH